MSRPCLDLNSVYCNVVGDGVIPVLVSVGHPAEDVGCMSLRHLDGHGCGQLHPHSNAESCGTEVSNMC